MHAGLLFIPMLAAMNTKDRFKFLKINLLMKTETKSFIFLPLSVESILAKGDRVELIPVKDGVKIIHIKRKEVKP